MFALFLFCAAFLTSICNAIPAYGPLVPNVAHVDTDYSVISSDVVIMINTTLGSITIFLPNANLVPGRTIDVIDEGGYVGMYPALVQCYGSQGISGYGNSAVIAGSYQGLRVISAGSDMWLHWQIT